MTPYGNIIDIQNEKWTKHYRYSLDNGVRLVTIHLKQHAPSHLTVAGLRVLISYDGQPTTCYECGGYKAAQTAGRGTRHKIVWQTTPTQRQSQPLEPKRERRSITAAHIRRGMTKQCTKVDLNLEKYYKTASRQSSTTQTAETIVHGQQQ
jgi:hypothetical protein